MAGETGKDAKLTAGLYLVATPIGHAEDITLRALRILREADMLAAEDTRRTRQLLEIHGIPLNGRRIQPYHDHSAPGQRAKLLAAVAGGASLAYVSDAGTPLVADPGYRLAADAIAEGLPVTAAPGASAVLTALSTAGLPTDRFLFAGFPPTKAGARTRFLEELRAVPATLVFYESPRRLGASLAAMAETLGPRPAAVCRELTKRFEEAVRGPLPELAARYADAPPKGEIVIVVGPPLTTEAAEEDLDTALTTALETLSVKDAAATVASALNVPRKRAYARALELTRG